MTLTGELLDRSADSAVPGDPGRPGRTVTLLGRQSECAALGRLVDALRSGESQALVVRGDPGVGKTALLDYLAGQAAGCRVVRVAGVQPEMELAFAGLHQLCAPLLDSQDRIPAPQREALRVALGLSQGPAPDRFLVALAVLGLLSEAAAVRPLLCVVDDLHWLDRASAQVLGFVARRLAADPVAIVFAARALTRELSGLPELRLAGLADPYARELLDSALTGTLDEQVRDQIVAETRGNPLALLELLRGLTQAQLAGGFGLPGAVSLTSQIEESFARRLRVLPDQTRSLLRLAAADPSGSRALVWRAAGRLGIPLGAAAPAVEAGLVEFGTRVSFRHPLLRSAAYRSAPLAERQAIHLALAEATDPAVDPDRRAWHRAEAAPGPDEAVAAELVRSADQAKARGGPAAAAAFLQRASLLTVDCVRRAERILAAAEASLQAGSYEQAVKLLEEAEAEPLAELQRARVDMLRGHVAFASDRSGDAPELLLKAARRLEPLDRKLALQTYLDACPAAMFAGHLAATATLPEICRAIRRLLPAPDLAAASNVILDAFTLLVTDGPAVAGPALRKAVDAFMLDDITADERLRLSMFAECAAIAVWDMDAWRAMVDRHAAAIRARGEFHRLPRVLAWRAAAATWTGDLAAIAPLAAESDAVCAATGTSAPPYAALMLPALRGDETVAVPLVEATATAAAIGGQGLSVRCADWGAAILYNGLGRYEQALTAARQASQDAAMHVSLWALPELIEAAVHSRNADLAIDPMARLAESARAGGTDFGLGIEARSRALLSDGDAADRLYREAIERLARTPYRLDLARAYLLHGEWLRRAGRRVDARTQLRAAYTMLTDIGAAAFAERARRELTATGATVRKFAAETHDQLTPQEEQIARLVLDGLSNPEIAAQLFLSARTVEWHLRKVFIKLGIGSRRELQARWRDASAPAAFTAIV